MIRHNFILHRPNSKTATAIYLHVNKYGLKYPIGESILPKEWDNKKKQSRAEPDLNKKLLGYSEVIHEIWNKYRFAEFPLTKEILKKELSERFSKSDTQKDFTLISFISWYIEECKLSRITDKRTGQPIKQNTYKGYGNLLFRLETFSKVCGNVDFADIGMDFYRRYTHFLRFDLYKHTETKRATLGLSENSIGTDIKNLKKFMNEAIERKLTDNVGHRQAGFKAIEEQTDSIALDIDKIKAIENLDLTKNKHLIEERDRFLCAYNFLLRFTDSISISEGNIITKDGRHFLNVRTTKTGEKVLVPIREATMEILKRNNFEFKSITNQESNWKLKELGRLAKIDRPVTVYEHREGKVISKVLKEYELITTHTSRRSAATNLLKAGVMIKVIMDLGGWKTEDEFFKYIRISKEESAMAAARHEFFK